MASVWLSGEQVDALKVAAAGDEILHTQVVEWADQVRCDHALLENLLMGYCAVKSFGDDGPVFTITPKGSLHVENMSNPKEER